jgi:hypothetical protein
MLKLYPYVGPPAIAARVAGRPAGFPVNSPQDVRQWIRQTGQTLDRQGQVTATFVVDELGALRIADRRSEHVACAGGKPVLSAGEITFSVTPRLTSVEWVTNQSTGYCPEPESWPAVGAALNWAGIQGPAEFSQACLFRRCVRCGLVNIVKDGFFYCDNCSWPLPSEWNVTPDATLVKER